MLLLQAHEMWNYEPLPQHPDPSHCLHPLIKIKKTKQQIENKTQLIKPKLHPKRVRNSTITIYIKLRCLATNKLYTLSSSTTTKNTKENVNEPKNKWEIREKPVYPDEYRELDLGACSMSILISFRCGFMQEKQLILLTPKNTRPHAEEMVVQIISLFLLCF